MKLSTAIQEFDLSINGVTAPGTRALYLRYLNNLTKFLGDVEIEQVTISDLRRWRVTLTERDMRWENIARRPAPGPLSPWTIHNHVRVVRRFFTWLRDEGYLAQNPAARLEKPPLPDEPPKALSEQNLRRLLEAARETPRTYAILCFLADTAAREGAVVGLLLEDLDLENRSALIHDKGRGGRRKARYVYFSELTEQALRDYLRVRPENGDDQLFLSACGRKINPNAIYQLLKRLAQKAGVKGRWNPHSFRHGWARGALKKGADLGTVSDILGHSDIEVTKRFYARWADDELQERHERFTWMNDCAE